MLETGRLREERDRELSAHMMGMKRLTETHVEEEKQR